MCSESGLRTHLGSRVLGGVGGGQQIIAFQCCLVFSYPKLPRHLSPHLSSTDFVQ